MTDTEKQTLEKVLQGFGYTIARYVQDELVALISQKKADQEKFSHYYRLKYQVDTPEEMSAKFHDYPFDIIEKEHNHWHWEEIIDVTEHYDELLTTLQTWKNF